MHWRRMCFGDTAVLSMIAVSAHGFHEGTVQSISVLTQSKVWGIDTFFQGHCQVSSRV